MPRNVTVTFEDGTSHVYQNAPDDLTPEQAQARAVKDFSKRVVHLDGGRPAAPQQPAAPEEGFFSRLAKEPGYLGAAAERGALGLGASLQGYQASGIAEMLEVRKQKLAEATPEQKADPKWMEARLREIKEDEEAYARRMAQGAEYNKRSQDILESQRTRPESRLMFGAGKPERGWGEAASEIGTALVKDPGSLVDLALTSGPQMLAMIAATMLTRGAGAPTTGAALVGGLTSKEIEFGNEYAENRQEGMSHEDAWNAAQAKSGIVGALDAVSMKTAGKTLDALTDAVKAAKSGHKGAVRTALKETGKEVATQAGLGATGEALGSVAAGKEISPTGVLLEALGETVTAPGEAAVMRSRISRGLESTKPEAKAKGKRSAEEAAIDALDQETVEERAVEDANQKFEEAALEDQQQPPMGGTELEGTEQRTTGGAGVDVPVSQPPTEAPATAGVGRGGLDAAEGPTGEAVSGEGQPAGALTSEQVDALFAAGITASQIENGVEAVRYARSGERNLQDVLLTPIARDHAAGLTSEKIAKKNKIDTPFARMLQVGLGLVPNEKVKPAAVEAPVAETPAAETPAVETPAAETPAAEIPKHLSDLYAKYEEATKWRSEPYKERTGKELGVIKRKETVALNELNEAIKKYVGPEELSGFEQAGRPSKAGVVMKQLEAEAAVAAETPAAETPAPAAEAPTSTALATISKREPVEAPKGVLRSKYTFSDGSAYQIEKREDEFHLVGVPDENDSYLGKTRGEAERALNDDKNSGRLDQVIGRGEPGALQLEQKSPEQVKGESEYAENQVKEILEAKLQDFMVGDLVRFGNMSGAVIGLEGDYVRFRPDSATSSKAYHRVPKKSLSLVARPDTTSEVSYSRAQDNKFGEEAGQLNADMGNLIQLLGANMYQSSLADVAIKELIQNAFDAVKGAVASVNAKGEKLTPLYKSGNIEVIIDQDNRTITIKDDARGMTPEIVRNAFFTVAGSDKSDLPPDQRSGGLGLAKMGFMLGSEQLVLDTVRDGVRVKVDTTAKDIANSNFKIIKSPAPKGEHGTTITVKIPEKYTDPKTGEEKRIYFPYSLDSIDPLQKPLVGPVAVKATIEGFGEPKTSVLPVGVNFPENKYTKFTANFDWGSADIYFAVDRNTSGSSWGIKHEVLSSGVYQFAPDFKLNNEKIPYDIIVNVKPNVDARHPDYPFENSRERFKGRLDKDVAALTAYLGQIARGYEAKGLQESFKGVVSMPRIEAGEDIAGVAEKLKKSFGSQPTGKPAELKPLPKQVTITADKVQDTKTKQILVDVAAKEAEKKKEASFKGEAAPKALDFMLELKQDPKLPVFHNNTNVDFIEIGKEYGEPEKFFAELGTLMVEMKEALAKSGMYGYDKLSPENLFFGGVSIDKQYGGVHIRVPYKAVFINPFYDFGAKTLFGAATRLINTMIHEIAHTGSMDHGVAHNTHYVRVEQHLADEGLLDYYRDAILDVLRRHESTFTAMREAYGRSTTRNAAKSLEEYGKDASAASYGGGRGSIEYKAGAVPAGERPGRGEGLRAAATDSQERQVGGRARGPSSLATQGQDSIDVDGKTRPLTNSRGQRIHPTDEGVRNFWRGFGNSKVVDEEGRPLVMYTGTSKDKDFSSFNVPKNGAWFTTDSGSASQYAVENDSMDLVYSEGKYRPVNTASRVIPAYLSIRNPYKMTEADFAEINKQGYKRAQGQFFDALRFQGYDGVDMGSGIWVVLKSPTQVKSAVGNTGAFSPTEKKILATQEQEPTVLGLHPTVSQALRAGDLNGVLKAIANTTSGFSADLARRLAELNLPTVISTGTARARQLTRASIDLVSAPQQNRLFSYVQLQYPALYSKYFQNYDTEANLERVYDGLNELKKVLPEVNPVSAEFSDVLQAYNDNIESIDPRTLGFYSPDFDEVNVDTDRKTGTSNYVLLHETTHAATEMLITQYENAPETLTAEQRAAAKKLQELYEYTKENYPGDPKTYGLRNIYEFVAEAFTNRGFQTKLKDMTYDVAEGSKTSVWSRFVKSILDLFGVNTVAANVMIEANKLFSADRPRARKSIGPMFAKKQKNGPVSGGWRAAYDHNTTLIKLFQDAIKGRVPLSKALSATIPVLWDTSAVYARQVYLTFAPLRELAEATKSKFPQLTGAIKIVEQLVAYRGQKMKLAEDIVKDWGKLQSERFQQSALLGRVMLSATLQNEDPDAGNGTAALTSAWNALSPEAQSIYRRVRDFYANSVREMILEMKARARANLANDPAALKKALSDIDALFKGIKGPYFPLRRFGSYWFQVGTTDKDKEFYTFESVADREFAMNERMEELQNGTPAQKKLAETLKLGNSIGEIFDQNKDPTGVLGRVEDLIDSLTATNPADVKKELKDSVHQLMYVLLPQQSMKKMFINRKGIQGASADMLRVFSDSAVHSAYQQARFKYSQDFLNNLTNARDYIGEAQKTGLFTPKQRSVYDDFIAEVGKRSGTILSTEDKRFTARAAAAANEATFFWMLTAPATAILNIFGAAQFSLPEMSSRFGAAKTTALLAKNMAKYGASVPTRTLKPLLGRQFLAVDFPSMVEGGSLSNLQGMFAKAFIDAGDINISLTNSLFEFGEQPSALYTGRMNTVKKFASGAFHQAERFAREMVLMTSAELAYNKLLDEPIKNAKGVIQRDANGKPIMRTKDATGFSQQAFDDALAEARAIAGTTLGDFSRAMKPRVTQSPVGSVLLSMKSFAITASFFLMRNTDLSLNRPFRSDEMADMRAALLAQKIPPNVVDQQIKEAQAELKASYSEARKRMAGVMGVTFLLGGLQAQPFFSLLLPALVAALKPDDDEEDEFFNNENWFRNYMEKNLGGYLGEMAMRMGMEEQAAKKTGRKVGEAVSGGIPAAAGVSLTERVSIDPKDLWYRSGRFSPDYRTTVMETAIANAGPAVGLAMNIADAAQLMEEGRYQRAFERALPAIVSNPLKAARFGKEGAVTKSGATQVEEFTTAELAMQALGFQPERLAQKQKAAMEATTVKMQIQDKRNGVLDRLYLERNSEKGYEYALQMMDEYNDKYPYYAIKQKDIVASFKRRDKAAAEAYGIGVAMPKKMRGRLEPMVEYAKDEDED